MALPGRLDNSYGVGVNRLIQNGAKLVICIEDILENLPQFTHKIRKILPEKQVSFFDVKEEYQEIMKILQNNTLSAEEIMQKTKSKNLRETLNNLINMELEGILIQELGIGYKIQK